MKSLLSLAHDEFCRRATDPNNARERKFDECFCFLIGETVVCEKAFANALGLVNNKGEKCKVWNKERKKFLG